jgi:hypothetical protein
MSFLVYPIGFEIRTIEVEDGSWELYFKEFFPKGISKEILERTRETAIRIGYEVKIDENSVSYTVKRPKTEIFDMLAGEFLSMSTIGNRTLGEIFAAITIFAAKAKTKE